MTHAASHASQLPEKPSFAMGELRGGVIGVGMIFDDTYRPFFEAVEPNGLYDRRFGCLNVSLAALASRTGLRAAEYLKRRDARLQPCRSFSGANATSELLATDVDFVCVATPDHRHFDATLAAIESGRHVLIEKPSVLSLQELDRLVAAAKKHHVLAKVVYHKLLDPDHKKLRTLVVDDVLQHVNNGYCSLLEPRSISGGQFAEWIQGRNPATYVAVHYIKLIDFTFGGKLIAVTATGQRGLVGQPDGNTWDSVQLRLTYEYASGRTAAFDIHTSWVTPDNFPGYVEQEVQFRFDNGVWNGHSRKRGVELTVAGETPLKLKTTLNNHYNGTAIEPWGERTQRGYGVEVIERFVREVGFVEFGGPADHRSERLEAMRALAYNDLQFDRQVVAAIQALEAILEAAAAGEPHGVVHVNTPAGGLVLSILGKPGETILYPNAV